MNTRDWDDHYLAQQLEQLPGLPEGYAPNLHSKWELLAASLDQAPASKKGVLWVWSLAASVCLVAALALLLQQAPAPSAATTPSVAALPTVIPTEPIVSKPAPLPPKSPVRNRAANRVALIAVPETTAELVTPPEHLAVESPPPAPLAEQASAAKKKSKARFVQMDFGGAEPVAAPPPVLASGVHFKWRSSISTATAEVNETQQPTSPRIRF